MICKRCKKETDPSFAGDFMILYCGQCGTPITENCPICGQYHEIDSEFCTRTGKAIAPVRKKQKVYKEKKEKQGKVISKCFALLRNRKKYGSSIGRLDVAVWLLSCIFFSIKIYAKGLWKSIDLNKK